MSKPIFIKEKNTGVYKFYSSLTILIGDYPSLKQATVEHYISRNKQPYIDENVEIYKGEIIRGKRK